MKKTIFDFAVLYTKKEGFKQEIKVFTLDIRIKQSELKVLKFPAQIYHEKIVLQKCMLMPRLMATDLNKEVARTVFIF